MSTGVSRDAIFHPRMSSNAAARIESALFDQARRVPWRVALVDGDRELSFGDLAARAADCARTLRARGLAPGERATIFLDKTPESVVALYGVWTAGGIAVPASETLKARQLDHVVRHSESRFLLTDARKLGRTGFEPPRETEVVLVGSEPAGPAGPAGPGGIDPLASAAPAGVRGGPEPAAILYTSGSTGRPKGIVLSHENLRAGARIVAGYLGTSAEDRILAVLPLAFDYGLNQLLIAVRCGATLVLQRSHFPADIARALRAHRITTMAGVPPLWVQLMAPASPLRDLELPDLHTITNSGGAFPVELLRRYRERLPGVRIFLMYGLTEAFRSTYLPPEQVDERPRSIGKAIPETEILVLDPSGRPCEPGEVGELVHRGPTVALGYWRDPEATARVFRPDPSGAPGLAVHSGDRVRRDEEGFLHYVGRADQLLKCSGYRLNPEEVEEVLLASGLVQEAVVRGEPDEAAGTRLVAHVVPRAGGAFSAAALLDWCRREMPGYMVPARIVEHAAFPRTSSLKIDRVSVRG